MKSLCAAILIVLMCSFAQAALPPNLERAREIAEVAQNTDVEKILLDARYQGKSSGMINAIAYVGDSNSGADYLITSGKCTLEIRLDSNPSDPAIVGPWEYKIVVAPKMKCRS